MKIKLISLFLFLFLISCSSYNKILVINDPFREEKSIKLLQSLEGYSDELKSFFHDRDYYFPIKTVYSKPEDKAGSVVLELKLTTIARPEELDSVIYMMLDNEKIRLVSIDYRVRNYVHNSTSSSMETTVTAEGDDGNAEDTKTTTQTTSTTITTDQTFQAMKHRFEIPIEIWGKLSGCNAIMLRAYVESEGIDVRFSSSQRNKFTKFFAEVLRNEN